MPTYPLSRLLSKLFLRPEESGEAELAAAMYWGLPVRYAEVRFKALRVGRATWATPGFAKLPNGVKVPPYWVTPWLQKQRPPMTRYERIYRRLTYPLLRHDFRRLLRTMERKGWVGESAKVVELVEGKNWPYTGRRLAMYVDGNRRLGIASILGLETVPVEVVKTVSLDESILFGLSWFEPDETAIWWNHAFGRVYGEETNL